jgi:hypothetical protein
MLHVRAKTYGILATDGRGILAFLVLIISRKQIVSRGPVRFTVFATHIWGNFYLTLYAYDTSRYIPLPLALMRYWAGPPTFPFGFYRFRNLLEGSDLVYMFFFMVFSVRLLPVFSCFSFWFILSQHFPLFSYSFSLFCFRFYFIFIYVYVYFLFYFIY